MKMNAYNERVALGVADAISGFVNQSITLSALQSALQNAAPLFENDGSGVDQAVRLAEADIEAIRFTMMLEDQLPAAIDRLSLLRSHIENLMSP